MVLKELGSLQEKVLFFLAENPGNHKKAIQKGIRYPDDQYGSVKNAVDALERLKMIKAKGGKSKKQVSIKYYDCTEEGVVYALFRNPNVNIEKTLEAYKKYEFIKDLDFKYHNDREIFDLIFKGTRNVLPMIHEKITDEVIGHILFNVWSETKDLKPEERIEFIKRLGNFSPNAKKALEEMKYWLNQL